MQLQQERNTKVSPCSLAVSVYPKL